MGQIGSWQPRRKGRAAWGWGELRPTEGKAKQSALNTLVRREGCLGTSTRDVSECHEKERTVEEGWMLGSVSRAAERTLRRFHLNDILER